MPEIPRIPIGDWFQSFVDWLTSSLEAFFELLDEVVEGAVEGLTELLVLPPSLIMVVAFAALAWWLRGWGTAVFTLLGFGLIVNMELWEQAMETLSLVLVAVILAIIISIPIGILAAKNLAVSHVVKPILDFMQTMPALVYLLLALAFFSVGLTTGVAATVVFSLPPGVRLTELAIRQVDPEMVEAGEAFGTPPGRILSRIQIPLGMPTIMAGINQVIMLALSMVVIGAFAGAAGLGDVVVAGISQAQVGIGFEGGLAVVILAIFLDRITAGMGDRTKVARAQRQAVAGNGAS